MSRGATDVWSSCPAADNGNLAGEGRSFRRRLESQSARGGVGNEEDDDDYIGGWGEGGAKERGSQI